MSETGVTLLEGRDLIIGVRDILVNNPDRHDQESWLGNYYLTPDEINEHVAPISLGPGPPVRNPADVHRTGRTELTVARVRQHRMRNRVGWGAVRTTRLDAGGQRDGPRHTGRRTTPAGRLGGRQDGDHQGAGGVHRRSQP